MGASAQWGVAPAPNFLCPEGQPALASWFAAAVSSFCWEGEPALCGSAKAAWHTRSPRGQSGRRRRFLNEVLTQPRARFASYPLDSRNIADAPVRHARKDRTFLRACAAKCEASARTDRCVERRSLSF